MLVKGFMVSKTKEKCFPPDMSYSGRAQPLGIGNPQVLCAACSSASPLSQETSTSKPTLFQFKDITPYPTTTTCLCQKFLVGSLYVLKGCYKVSSESSSS